MNPPSQALFTDFYELTMAQSYFDAGIHEQRSAFSLFTRSLPSDWSYMIFAGLPYVIDYLDKLSFGPDEIDYLRSTGSFSEPFLDYLSTLRFTGTVRALREGEMFFANTPLIEVEGGLAECQLIETFLINQIHLHSLLASKASRCIEAADGITLLDFSLRRTHGTEAGLAASRSSYLAGFAATSNVEAGRRYDIPVSGTMAHAFVGSFPTELEAFRAYAASYPDRCVLLIDTYDTLEGARRATIVGKELAEQGHKLAGVRIDSGDLAEQAKDVRAILDEAGLTDTGIFVSGDLDEWKLTELIAEGAPISGAGVGTRMGTSADQPTFSLTYKLVELNGRPVGKLSASKATWPLAKQAYRVVDPDGLFDYDVLGSVYDEAPAGAETLLQLVFDAGRVSEDEPATKVRQRVIERREQLPEPLRALRQTERYSVEVTESLEQARAAVARAASALV